MKKIFSLVLVLALTLALGIPALAAEADETAVPEITLSADAETVPAGKTAGCGRRKPKPSGRRSAKPTGTCGRPQSSSAFRAAHCI